MSRIIGTGIDMVEVARIARAVRLWDRHFTTRVFTEGELRYCTRNVLGAQRLAARFAAKEAVIKAFGEPCATNIRFTDMEITHTKNGKPIMMLSGDMERLRTAMAVQEIMISLSHTKDYALASATIIGE